jgi:hypothetical protein
MKTDNANKFYTVNSKNANDDALTFSIALAPTPSAAAVPNRANGP